MSAAAAHANKLARRACEQCRLRKARFRYRGTVKADRDHTLCFACFRAERERRRAYLLARIERITPLQSPLRAGDARALSGTEVEHRRRMLAHLRSKVR